MNVVAPSRSKRSRLSPSDRAAMESLEDLRWSAKATGTPWALIGGRALIAHGVRKDSDDVDILVPPHSLKVVANALVDSCAFQPLEHVGGGRFVMMGTVSVHWADAFGKTRFTVPLLSPLGMRLELLGALHKAEHDTIATSNVQKYLGLSVPVAPLGGVLLLKTMARRDKDVAAIEQAARNLTFEQLRSAMVWAVQRDAKIAAALWSIIHPVRELERRLQSKEHE